eukprot:gene6319-8075_t
MRRLEEEEEENLKNATKYTPKDLTGLKVIHSASDFELGSEVILTLADSSVLTKDDKGKILGINEDDDILENVNMADEERRRERENIKKRARQPVYAGYDDAEFEEGVLPGTKPNILSQYDKEKKSGPKLVLGIDDVNPSGDHPSDLREMTNYEKVVESLKVESSEMSNFYTKAEFEKFSKKNKKDDKKKKRKIRKRESLEDDEGRDGDVFAQLEASIDEGVVGGNSADRGRRGDPNLKSKSIHDQLSGEDVKRKSAYESAVSLAEEKAERAFANLVQENKRDGGNNMSSGGGRGPGGLPSD